MAFLALSDGGMSSGLRCMNTSLATADVFQSGRGPGFGALCGSSVACCLREAHLEVGIFHPSLAVLPKIAAAIGARAYRV